MLNPHSKPSKATRVSAALARQAREGRVRVGILGGGTFQEIARRPDVAGCHLIAYADVTAEMAAVEPAPDVIRLTLAPGQTIGTLTKEHCPAALKELLAHRPGVTLGVGLAQLRPIGRLAVEKLLADPTFAYFVRSQILDELLILTNGNLQEIELLAFSSGAGGTGGAITNLLMAAVFGELRKRSLAVVHLRNLRAGSLSFVGAGDRVHCNTAASIVEDLWQILVLPRDEREVRSLCLTELPMLKGAKEERSACATLAAQALSCGAVRDRLDMVAPNLATQSEFGTVTIVNTDFWHSLDQRRIAEDAVRDYVPRLEELRGISARQGQSVEARPVPVFAKAESTPSVEDLMAEVRNSPGVEPQELVNRALAPPEQLAGGSVSVTVSPSVAFDLGPDMLAVIRVPVATVAEWREKLEVLQTTLLSLDRALLARAPEARRLDRVIQAAERQLQKALKLLYPKRLGEHISAFIAGPKTNLHRLQNAINKCRELSGQKLKLDSETRLLSDAKGRIEEILSAEQRRVERLLGLLRPLQRPAGLGAQRLVECAPLDQVLPRLVSLAEQEKTGHDVLQFLETSAQQVTLAGLAEITGASEPQPANVAQRLLGSDPPVRSPRWGGQTPRSSGMRIIVLPPVDPAVAEAIQAHVASGDGNTLVTVCDTAQGGCNIVELDVHFPRELTEILTRFVEGGARDAASTPEAYVAADDQSLPWILNRLAGASTTA